MTFLDTPITDVCFAFPPELVIAAEFKWGLEIPSYSRVPLQCRRTLKHKHGLLIPCRSFRDVGIST